MLPILLAYAAVNFVIAYGLLREQRRARSLAVWGYVALAAAALLLTPRRAFLEAAPRTALFALVSTLALYGYFYWNPRVLAYYARLDSARTQP